MNEDYLIKQELESIIEHSNDNIVVTDGEGVVLRTSPNCERIYGQSQSYLIGKSVFQLQEEDIFNPSVTIQVLKKKKEVQLMQTTPKGRVIMATGIPIFSEANKLIRIISFSHDLTEIQQIKEDYEHLKVKMKRYELEIEQLREKETKVAGIIAKDEAIKHILELILRTAKSDASVVLLGESGVGKSMFARALHNHSHRSKEPFIEVNCGAIPDNLFESEVFGYESGAFTGASQKGKLGFIELADQGTLFLDEIGEIPLNQQVKLLKVLENKEVVRVGGSEAIDVDFRLVTATNQDLEKLVKEGKFRKDLYYRLNVVPIVIPPLRERKKDIYELAYHYLTKFNKKYNTNKVLHMKTITALQNYDWPGNVRELENLIERLLVTVKKETIYPYHLSFFNEADVLQSLDIEHELETFEEQSITLHDALEAVEKRWLKRAYRQYKTTYEMAEYLGVSQSTVVRRLQKYSIDSK